MLFTLPMLFPEERAAIANSAASDLMRYLKRPTAASFTHLTLLDYFETYIITRKKRMTPSQRLHQRENDLTSMAILFPPGLQSM